MLSVLVESIKVPLLDLASSRSFCLKWLCLLKKMGYQENQIIRVGWYCLRAPERKQRWSESCIENYVKETAKSIVVKTENKEKPVASVLLNAFSSDRVFHGCSAVTGRL